MAGPIYRAFRASFSEAWYQLSKDEQESLMAKVNQALKEVGGKSIALCDSSWSSEQWEFFGIEEFPNTEALQRHSELLKAFDWPRYRRSSTLLGTATMV
jgi:hypothetical protein